MKKELFWYGWGMFFMGWCAVCCLNDIATQNWIWAMIMGTCVVFNYICSSNSYRNLNNSTK